MEKYKNKNSVVVYGTLKECVNELWKEIDFKTHKFPRVDYAANVWDSAENAQEAFDGAEGWFGFADTSNLFDCDTFTLLFAHYGGGGVESMEMYYGAEEEDLKEMLMQRIGSSTDQCGYGVLEPNDYTVFEIY